MRDFAVVSVCRVLPTPDNPSAGQFVMRRIAGMARHANVQAVQPVPYFPWIRPLPSWARDAGRQESGVHIEHAPMLYVPGAFKSLDGRWLERAVVPALARARKQHSDFVVDAHFGYPDGVGCVRAARRLGLPVFVTLRGMEVDRLKLPGIRGQLVDAMNAANGCIAVSHSLKDAVVEAGVDAVGVTVIHNAIDRKTFRPGVRDDARARLGIPRDTVLLVSVGNMVELKRHTVLVEAVARLTPRFPHLALSILGGGDSDAGYTEEVSNLARDLGISSRVRIVGRVPPGEVVDWLQSADVFALATSREGCCNAVLEALACGIPVVTTPAGDNARFVRPGENGYLVPIDDPDAMASSLSTALDRKDWHSHEISSSLQVGDWENVGRRVLDFFAERRAA